MSVKETKDAEKKSTSFIPKTMRPLPSEEGEPAVLSPDAPQGEIRRRAGEALGPLLRGMLGADDHDTPLAPEHLCVRSGQVTFTEVDGESVLLDLGSGHYFTLNQQGTAIWAMLTGENDLGTIHAALCRRFRVDPETAWEDLVALVRNLCAEKLARVEEPKHAAP